jgi:hypothetical protein
LHLSFLPFTISSVTIPSLSLQIAPRTTMSVDKTADEAKLEQSARESEVAGPEQRRLFRLTTSLLFALLGGGLAWGLLQATFPLFELPPELANLGISASEAQYQAQFEAREAINRKHAIVYAAVLGALVGSGLSLAERARYPSGTAAALGAVTAFLLGGLFGAAGGFLGDVAYASVKTSVEPLPLVRTVLVQTITLGTLGLGIGLGLSAFRHRFSRASKNRVPAGILAGLCAGMCYPIVVSMALPFAQTESTLPMEPWSQSVWMMSISLLFGIIMPGAADPGEATTTAEGNK